jgi:hypothetical protein
MLMTNNHFARFQLPGNLLKPKKGAPSLFSWQPAISYLFYINYYKFNALLQNNCLHPKKSFNCSSQYLNATAIFNTVKYSISLVVLFFLHFQYLSCVDSFYFIWTNYQNFTNFNFSHAAKCINCVGKILAV